MYRCELCNACSKPGEPRLTHAIQRRVRRTGTIPDGQSWRLEIARELAVCRECDRQLKRGGSLNDMLKAGEDQRRAEEPPPLLEAVKLRPEKLF